MQSLKIEAKAVKAKKKFFSKKDTTFKKHFSYLCFFVRHFFSIILQNVTTTFLQVFFSHMSTALSKYLNNTAILIRRAKLSRFTFKVE